MKNTHRTLAMSSAQLLLLFCWAKVRGHWRVVSISSFVFGDLPDPGGTVIGYFSWSYRLPFKQFRNYPSVIIMLSGHLVYSYCHNKISWIRYLIENTTSFLTVPHAARRWQVQCLAKPTSKWHLLASSSHGRRKGCTVSPHMVKLKKGANKVPQTSLWGF